MKNYLQYVNPENKFKFFDNLSYRNYTLKKSNENISLILDETNQKFLLLEDLSSELFTKMAAGDDLKKIILFCQKHDIYDDLDDFCKELYDNHLLVKNNITKTHNFINSNESFVEGEDISFLNEMITRLEKENKIWAAHIDLTYSCNSKCIHCFNPNAQNRELNNSNQELKLQELFKSIDELYNLGVFKIILSGGEITLKKELWELVTYIRSKNISIELYTNGLLIDDNFIENIIKYSVSKVSLSIYSFDEKKHDEITQISGSYKKTIEAIQKLRKNNIRTEYKSVQLDSTIDDYFETQKLGEELGCNVIMDLSLSPQIDGSNNPLKYAISNEKLKTFMKKNIEINGFTPRILNPESKPCGAGINSLSITPFGDVYPCAAFPLKLGNVKDNSLQHIWSTSTELQKWQSIKVKDFKYCGNYDYCEYCGEICGAEAYLESGDYLNLVSNNCKKAKILQEIIALNK